MVAEVRGVCLGDPNDMQRVMPHGYTKWRAGFAHRLTYAEFYNTQIPKGQELDHLCRNRWCYCPWHLEPVTRLENVRRGLKGGYKQPGTCMRGHPMDGTNGRRHWCKTCNRERRRGLPPCQ